MSELVLTGASFHRGTSKQDYSTPVDFRDAIVKRFGFPSVDLASAGYNYFGKTFITESEDSFTKDWHRYGGALWLNPPFNNIAPWAKKCHQEASYLSCKILFLTPASIGSEWFAQYVYGRAQVLALRPRLCFDGKAPYPKDCILSCYNLNLPDYFNLWKWK